MAGERAHLLSGLERRFTASLDAVPQGRIKQPLAGASARTSVCFGAVPGADDAQRPSQRLRRGLDTSIVENSSAFGFSIMITASFGALSRLDGQPGIGTVFGFAVGAALTFTLLQAIASSGFRDDVESSSRRVVMLGTELNFVSVAAAVGVAVLVGLLLPPGLAWPVGGFLASGVYVLLEATELAGAASAGARQRKRGSDSAGGDAGR